MFYFSNIRLKSFGFHQSNLMILYENIIKKETIIIFFYYSYIFDCVILINEYFRMALLSGALAFG